VDPGELRSYRPAELDVYIAEAMLTGATSFKEIAANISEACGETVGAQVVSKRLRDPLPCAWACQQVHRSIGHRLGMIEIYKRYGKMANVNINISAQGPGIDYEQLSDEQLERIAKHKGRVLDIEKGPE
jgi:hypothetical protein